MGGHRSHKSRAERGSLTERAYRSERLSRSQRSPRTERAPRPERTRRTESASRSRRYVEANRDDDDVELGSRSASFVTDLPPYRAIPSRPPSYSDITKQSAYDAMTTLPYGVGPVLEAVTKKRERLPPSAADLVACEIIAVIIDIAISCALSAPATAAEACLMNLIGSWVMRLHHSHEAFAFYGGSTQGNYALAGAILAVLFTTTVIVIKVFLDDVEKAVFTTILSYLSPLPYSAAVGARAAAVGAARGFNMQTVANSAIANLVGSSFILALSVAFQIFCFILCCGFCW